MIILDENFPESQRQLLRGWRVSLRQIGYEAGRKGMQDDEILPFLRHCRRTTFFTLDLGFYQLPRLKPSVLCCQCLAAGHGHARSADCVALRHAWYTAGGAEKKALFLMPHRGTLTPAMHLLFHWPVL